MKVKKLKNFPEVLLVLVLVSFLIAPAFAQDSEEAGKTTPTVNPEIKEKVEERIQKVMDDQTENKRAFAGEITDINSSITLETRQGERQIQTGDETIIIGSKKENLETDDLEIGTYVIAMGYLKDSGILDARRVVVGEAPEPLTMMAVVGEVSDKSSDGEEIITVKRFGKDTVYQVETTGKTTITKKTDDKAKEIEFEDIGQGDRVVAIGKLDEDGNFLTATVIQVIPEQSDQAESEEKSEEETEPSPTPKTSDEEAE